jgi:tetratricopeptide (TPR) repeat protein
MRRDLTSQRERSRYLYSNDYSYFWSEKQADFLRTANEVLAEFADSPRTYTHVAYYLWHGLDNYDRAIEVLFLANRRGLLDDGGLQQLIGYLHERQRYAESIALLEPWVDREPDRMDLRVLLLRSYHHAARPQQFDDLAAETSEHFHKDGRWNEGNIAALAGVMVEAARSELAAGYFEEAVNLRQRTAPNRGIGDGTLSNYYSQLASAYSQLGQTDKAVDAAAGAIVSWGNDQNNRQSAVQSLKNVLAAAQDLDAYVKRLDKTAAQEGTDTPVIRKALGQVYQDQMEWPQAITQYDLALELQPGDRDVHQ